MNPSTWSVRRCAARLSITAACALAAAPIATFGAAGSVPGKDGTTPVWAIPDIDAIAVGLDVLDEKADVRLLSATKTDLLEDGRSTFVGGIRVSDGISVREVRHWKDDTSPYGLAFSGRGLVRIELPQRSRPQTTPSAEVLFVTLTVTPAMSSDPNELSYVSVAGAVLGFGLEPPTLGIRAGRIFMLNGGAREARLVDWVDAGVSYPVNAGYEAAIPLDFMLRIDPRRGEWDLYFGQRLCYAGIFHRSADRSIWVRSSGAGSTELSELAVASTNPLFEDRDADGIEDGVETELGFSDEVNDRATLDELGQFSNLQHFINRRKTYVSRKQIELEATLVEALAAAERGRQDPDLENQTIPDEQRRRRFTREELEREREQARRTLPRFVPAELDTPREKEGNTP